MEAAIETLAPDLSLGMTESEFRNTVGALQYQINEEKRMYTGLTITLECRLEEMNAHIDELEMLSSILPSVAYYPSAQHPSTSGPNHWDENLFYDVAYGRSAP
jgi:hypothetical protein